MTSTLPAPRLLDPSAVPTLRWGAIGAGGIVRTFASALHAHTPQRVVGIAARDLARTTAFAAELGIERAHATAEELVADPAIDAVYIGTPHTSHRDYALLAIAAGKHVLVEKPLAMSAAEGAEIAAAARAAGVFAMEAMWTRYLPQTDIIRQLLERGDLGEIHQVNADFGYRVPYDADGRMFNPDLGGGALLDMGVYPISFASMILGTPATVSAAGALAPTGVDARAAVQLTHASGAVAQVATSIVSTLPTRATIIGESGRLEVHSAFFTPSGLTLTINEEPETWLDTTYATTHEGINYQATAMASYVAEGRTESPVHTLDETISILATIDEARAQVAAAG